MRARLEAALETEAPMPELNSIAWLMLQTGWPYSELMAMPPVVLDDYLLIKEAQARAGEG
jgi:hypothetical protein